MQRTDSELTVLLCRESGGSAVAVARVSDPGLVQRVKAAAVQERRCAASTAPDEFSRRRALFEAQEIEQA